MSYRVEVWRHRWHLRRTKDGGDECRLYGREPVRHRGWWSYCSECYELRDGILWLKFRPRKRRFKMSRTRAARSQP